MSDDPTDPTANKHTNFYGRALFDLISGRDGGTRASGRHPFRWEFEGGHSSDLDIFRFRRVVNIFPFYSARSPRAPAHV